MATSPLANRFIAMAENDHRPMWQTTADLIKRAGRFVLAPEVVKLTLRVPEPAKLLPAIAHGIRLPHDPCWIEYSPEQVFASSDAGESAKECGLLFWRDAAGDVCNRLMVRKRTGAFVRPGSVVSNPDGISLLLYPCDAVFRPSGIFLRDTQESPRADDMANFRQNAEVLGWMGLTLVLLLTAKNAPLIVGESEDLERLNRQRGRAGKPPLFSARPVRWNLTREERRAVQTSTPFDANARARAMSHMVRGHVKVRKSGVFWWSPHFRSGEGAASDGRDYSVH